MKAEVRNAVQKACTGLETALKSMQELKALIATDAMDEDSDSSSSGAPPKPQAKAAPKPIQGSFH